MKSILSFCSLFFICLQLNAKTITKQIDNVLNGLFDKNGPGGVALVVKDGKTLYRKAFGMANLDYTIKMKPENVFQIGSITKQFTAMAIMQLKEQGLLNLDDEITKFIADYPTHDQKITVRHLLTHTSGITEFSRMKDWGPHLGRQDLSPEELVEHFKNKPLDFNPGDKFLYSNSAYILLGIIIEKVSGLSYPKYLEEKIFKPLEMWNSSYGSVTDIIPLKASGYSKSPKGYKKAHFLSMSAAYSAGAIFSTADDMYKWYKGLIHGEVINPSNFNLAISPTVLNDGEEVNYGFGWDLQNIQGSPMISHGGMMPGFMSWSNYLLEENVFVVVFSNCDCAIPREASYEISAIAIDKPFNRDEIDLDEQTLKSYEGVYSSETEEEQVVSYTNGKLRFYQPGGKKYTLHPYAKNEFFFDRAPHQLSSLTMKQNSSDEISAIRLLTIDKELIYSKTNKPFKKYPAIEVDHSQLKKYEGKFELFPKFFLEVRIEDDKLYVIQGGRNKNKLTPYAEHQFDSDLLDAQFTFNLDENNKVISFTLHQGNDMEAKKVE